MPVPAMPVPMMVLVGGVCVRRDCGGGKNGAQCAQNDYQEDRSQKQFPHDSSPAR